MSDLGNKILGYLYKNGATDKPTLAEALKIRPQALGKSMRTLLDEDDIMYVEGEGFILTTKGSGRASRLIIRGEQRSSKTSTQSMSPVEDGFGLPGFYREVEPVELPEFRRRSPMLIATYFPPSESKTLEVHIRFIDEEGFKPQPLLVPFVKVFLGKPPREKSGQVILTGVREIMYVLHPEPGETKSRRIVYTLPQEEKCVTFVAADENDF